MALCGARGDIISLCGDARVFYGSVREEFEGGGVCELLRTWPRRGGLRMNDDNKDENEDEMR